MKPLARLTLLSTIELSLVAGGGLPLIVMAVFHLLLSHGVLTVYLASTVIVGVFLRSIELTLSSLERLACSLKQRGWTRVLTRCSVNELEHSRADHLHRRRLDQRRQCGPHLDARKPED
jgi:hypothetical protein